MTIREELLNAGYTNEYVDIEAKKEYERILEEVNENKKTFMDTKIYKFITMDLAEYLLNRLSLYYYEKIQKNDKKSKEETIDKNNPVKLYEYYASNGIMPVKTIDNGNGNFTHIYKDGLVVNVKTTLTSIVDEKAIINFEKRRRRYLADYLNKDEEGVINMTSSEIYNLVKENERTKILTFKTKRKEK